MNLLKTIKNKLPILFLAIAIALASFRPANEIFSYVQTLELKNVKNLDADIKINAGILRLATHSQSQASFTSTFTNNSWKAEVQLDSKSGRLTIHQPEDKNLNMKDDDRNDWEIKIPSDLDTDLNLRMGAGEGNLYLNGSKLNKMDLTLGAGKFNINLANTSLSHLKVQAGVGELVLDLSGEQKKNLQATVDGGVGEIRLTLPKKVGVRVKVKGLGGIDRNDLIKKDGYYVNDQWQKTSNNIDVNINGGLGSVQLVLQ